MPAEPLQLHGGLEKRLHLRVLLGLRLELGLGRQGLRDGLVARLQLSDLVHLREFDLQNAARIPNRLLRPHRVERDDLSDVIPTVLLLDVLDDLLAPLIREVKVNVRGFRSLWVEHPLEDQAVLQRINLADAQQVSHNAAGGGPAPRSDEDVARLGLADEVPHDQEVTRVLALLDDIQLIVEAPPWFVQVCAVARLKLLLTQNAQVAVNGVPLGDREVGQHELAQGELEVATLGHLHAPMHGLRQLREYL